MNPLLQDCSGTTTETSRNMFSINQGTNEDDSQSNPHPEAVLLISGRDDRHDMATRVQRGCTQAHGIWFEILIQEPQDLFMPCSSMPPVMPITNPKLTIAKNCGSILNSNYKENDETKCKEKRCRCSSFREPCALEDSVSSYKKSLSQLSAVSFDLCFHSSLSLSLSLSLFLSIFLSPSLFRCFPAGDSLKFSTTKSTTTNPRGSSVSQQHYYYMRLSFSFKL